MTDDELFGAVRNAGLIPVRVRNEEGLEDPPRAFFDGEFEAFLDAAKEIGSKVVFIEPIPLEDWFFTYNPAEDEPDDLDAVDEEIDLAALSPALAAYKTYVGEHYTFLLSAKGGAAELNFTFDQDWVEQFELEIELAKEKADLQTMTSKIRRDKRSRN